MPVMIMKPSAVSQVVQSGAQPNRSLGDIVSVSYSLQVIRATGMDTHFLTLGFMNDCIVQVMHGRLSSPK